MLLVLACTYKARSAAVVTACICLVSLRRYGVQATFVDVGKAPFAMAVLVSVTRRKHWAWDLGYEAARLCEMDPRARVPEAYG